ncbi:MAG: formate/nitrite transporter family protein [Paracoccaceae bacterium]
MLPEITRRKRGAEEPAHDEDIAKHLGLSSLTVYEIISAEGREELGRPAASLWWSGVAAGLCISTSVLAEGILHILFEGHPYRPAIENLGYSLGFVLVILARLQLFTENTITVVLPVLKDPSRDALWMSARLWGVVLIANFTGTFLLAALLTHGGIVPPTHVEGMLEISRHFAHYDAWECFRYGIPAGFFIAAIVWMLPSSQGYELFVIVLFTYLIAMGDFTHVVAGSTEAFLLVWTGEIGMDTAMLGLILPTLAGNIAGGTGLFAVLAYGQVRAEMNDD